MKKEEKRGRKKRVITRGEKKPNGVPNSPTPGANNISSILNSPISDLNINTNIINSSNDENNAIPRKKRRLSPIHEQSQLITLTSFQDFYDYVMDNSIYWEIDDLTPNSSKNNNTLEEKPSTQPHATPQQPIPSVQAPQQQIPQIQQQTASQIPSQLLPPQPQLSAQIHHQSLHQNPIVPPPFSTPTVVIAASAIPPAVASTPLTGAGILLQAPQHQIPASPLPQTQSQTMQSQPQHQESILGEQTKSLQSQQQQPTTPISPAFPKKKIFGKAYGAPEPNTNTNNNNNNSFLLPGPDLPTNSNNNFTGNKFDIRIPNESQMGNSKFLESSTQNNTNNNNGGFLKNETTNNFTSRYHNNNYSNFSGSENTHGNYSRNEPVNSTANNHNNSNKSFEPINLNFLTAPNANSRQNNNYEAPQSYNNNKSFEIGVASGNYNKFYESRSPNSENSTKFVPESSNFNRFEGSHELQPQSSHPTSSNSMNHTNNSNHNQMTIDLTSNSNPSSNNSSFSSSTRENFTKESSKDLNSSSILMKDDTSPHEPRSPMPISKLSSISIPKKNTSVKK